MPTNTLVPVSATEKVIQTFPFSSACLSKELDLLKEQAINFSRFSAKQGCWL